MLFEFQYTALPDEGALRLLTLKPGEFFDPLQGDLIFTTFSAKPRYIALSYTWDDPVPEQAGLPSDFITLETVLAGGNSKNGEVAGCRRRAAMGLNGRYINVAHNLALALRYLRSASHPLVLWVDAICINQTDIEEVRSQATLKTAIYSRAVAVATWLGLNKTEIVGEFPAYNEDGCIEADTAMQKAYSRGNSKELASWFAEHVAVQSRVASRIQLEMRAAEEEALERLAAANQHGDVMIMASRYWRHIWALQEICVAQRVFFLYGPTLLVHEGAVRQAYDARKLRMGKGMETMLGARERRLGDSMRLETLIEEFASHICTDTRDKVYGLARLANDVNAIDITADYYRIKTSLAARKCIRDDGSETVAFVIDPNGSFYNIWCDSVQYRFQSPYYRVLAELNRDENEQLERLRHDQLTKVVRFAALVQNTLLGEVERELDNRGWANHPAATKDVWLLGPKLFGFHLVPARGYLAGQIIHFGPTYADFVGFPRHQTAWRMGWREYYRNQRDLEMLREMEERYVAKLLQYEDADIARIAPIQGDPFAAFSSSRPGPIDELVAMPADADCAHIIPKIIARLSTHRTDNTSEKMEVCRFLGTDHCMGLAPPGAAVGDWVIRFWGCDAAIIVRAPGYNTPNSNNSYTVIGRADVADIKERITNDDDVANEYLYPHNVRGDKWMDVVMSWRTLQRITAEVAV